MTLLNLTINGQSIQCPKEKTILEAADAAGIYIPRICSHPDVAPIAEVIWADSVYQPGTKIVGEKPGNAAGEEAHCNLCLVELEGQSEPVNSCTTPVEEGITVRTDTEEVVIRRKQALSKLLADHPRACLTCAQKEGCSRTDCSLNVPVEERCCVLLGHCELEKVSAYIGIPGDITKYRPPKLPATGDDPLFERDYNLCIGCLRCVRICGKVQKTGILGAVWKDNGTRVGTVTGESLKEAQCRFCGACVEVCPTGALRDKEGVPAVRRDSSLPCVGNCPAGIDIPGYVRAIAEGEYREALDIIRSSVPFPEILGYVCFHPCEDVCRRGEIDQAVAICDLKRFVAETISEDNSASKQKRASTGKKVAIIGAGPAGLTAAYYLAGLAHEISLFDKESKPGGMLHHGIPDYRLPPDVLDRELKVLETLRVKFHMNHRLGDEGAVDELKSQDFDAVLIAAGTSVSKPLLIENINLDGIFPGLEFLRSAKLSRKPALNGEVVVIGGGNVGIDAAMTAIRLGARSVHLVCLESREEMPAHDWEITQAEEEGVEIYPSWGPKRFTATERRVSGVEFIKCTKVFDEQGRFDPQYDEHETKYIPADSVIIAIGQQVDPAIFHDVEGLTRGPGQTVGVDENSTVGVEGVFVAGDVVRGPASVIEAIADGKRVADIIDRYLGGEGLAEVHSDLLEPAGGGLDTPDDVFQHARRTPETAEPEKRKSGFGLIRETFTEQSARLEARRCLQCFIRQSITPVILPPEPWQPLSSEAVDGVPTSEGVLQLLNAEKKVIRIAGTQNIQQSLRECLENPGDAKWFICEEDPMYTKRESELIQQYLQEYGELPGGGGGDDDLDDLF